MLPSLDLMDYAGLVIRKLFDFVMHAVKGEPKYNWYAVRDPNCYTVLGPNVIT